MKSLAARGALLLGLCTATAWACPPVPEPARLRALADQEQLDGYALLRVLKCGWQQSVPVAQAWYDAQQALHAAQEAEADGEQVTAFVALTRLNPAQIAPLLAEYVEDDLDKESPHEVVALARLKVSSATLITRFEQGLGPAIAWLRGRTPLNAQLELHLELSLAAQEIRQGRLDAARDRLATARRGLESSQAANEDAVDNDAVKELAEFEQLLAAPRAQSPATDAEWVLNGGPGRRFCGTGFFMDTQFGTAYLREQVLSRADAALALGELLAEDWRAQISRGARHTEFLARLLRQRYSREELRQGWDDALASLRNDETVTGLTVFGHFLPLPAGVIEIAAAEPETGARRRLSDAELAELVRNTPLYKATNPG